MVPQTRSIARKYKGIPLKEILTLLRSEFHEERLCALLLLAERFQSEPGSRRTIFEAYLATLHDLFAGTPPGIAEENVQARIRGNLLMALSNKFGWLPLATGNKSELAVGYSTLYGDMVGGFAPIKDVFKVRVYDLAKWRNTVGDAPVIVGETGWVVPSRDSDALAGAMITATEYACDPDSWRLRQEAARFAWTV